MKDQRLRVLIVEDSEDDTLLLVRELRRGGYVIEFERVDQAQAMRAALDRQIWNLVITDHNMPDFDSTTALHLVKEKSPDTPVIIVSGSIGEEFAVSAMKAGAQDYVMKDNLKRLVPAVQRELREAENRKAHREAQEAIRHMAFHDGLTDLINRREFEQRLVRALDGARSQGLTHALLYMDLDQFKLINDTCGHVAGDELLRQVAVLFQKHVRETDTLARLGGDEFGVLLNNCPIKRALEIAENIRQTIANFRFVWADRPFNLGISIGVVAIESNTKSVSEILRMADLACYAAKDLGRNRVHFYAEGDADLARRHSDMQWATRLRKALETERFVLYYQPIIPLAAGPEVKDGVEFLLRLREDHRTLISPGTFIGPAEHYNIMPELDRWVINQAFGHIARLGAKAVPASAAPRRQYFINLSGTSLNDETIYSFVRNQLNLHRLPPDLICFEISETAAISNLGHAAQFIQDVRKMGCRLALDDFGSGLSSFSYLKALPVDYIKIDGGFVRNVLKDSMDFAIVESINRIGRVAGIRIIAQCVEEQAILEQVKKLGLDYAQGSAIQEPQPLLG